MYFFCKGDRPQHHRAKKKKKLLKNCILFICHLFLLSWPGFESQSCGKIEKLPTIYVYGSVFSHNIHALNSFHARSSGPRYAPMCLATGVTQYNYTCNQSAHSLITTEPSSLVHVSLCYCYINENGRSLQVNFLQVFSYNAPLFIVGRPLKQTSEKNNFPCSSSVCQSLGQKKLQNVKVILPDGN